MISRTTSAASHHRVVFSIFLATLALSLAGCGPANLDAFVRGDDTPYAKSCALQSAAQQRKVDDLVYNPVRLMVHLWPKTLPGGKYAELAEVDLLQALIRGQVHRTLVVARGGVGKTTLGKALVANICGQMPVFRIDLKRDIAAHLARLPKGESAIVRGIEASLRMKGKTDASATLREMLGQQRFLVILDSLDEVHMALRSKVLAQVDLLHQRYPKTAQTIVFARPAIYKPNYGIKGLDSKLEIPALDCSRASSTLAWTTKDDEEKARVQAFVRMFELDSQSKIRNRCYHPYLATYRDIQVVHRMAKTFSPKTEMGGLRANLSTVHERIVAERLQKELKALKWTQDMVLSAIDGMLRVKGREDGQWNLEFTPARCLETRAKAGSQPEESRYICEKILQSALFEPINGVREWRFAHRHVADLFLARWLDREIAVSGCSAVDKNGAWLSSKSVVGYLVGQKHGGGCLFELSMAICKDHGFERRDVDRMYKGLPMGDARKPLVDAARVRMDDFLKAGGSPSNLSCVRKLVDAL